MERDTVAWKISNEDVKGAEIINTLMLELLLCFFIHIPLGINTVTF